jgi:hypothetical protein
MEVIGLLMVIITAGTLLTYLEAFPRNPARYSGRVFDPQRPVIRRAGAERIGMTGRVCYFCDAVTYGYSPYCGRCKRVGPDLSGIRTQSTARLTLVESTQPTPSLLASKGLSSSGTPVTTTQPCDDRAATAHQLTASPSLSPASGPPRGTRTGGGSSR